MFTANPVNGKRDELVINAAWGLGEAIVSGAVTPDTATKNIITNNLVPINGDTVDGLADMGL